jgi:hypothetical protein
MTGVAAGGQVGARVSTVNTNGAGTATVAATNDGTVIYVSLPAILTTTGFTATTATDN